MEQSDSSQPKEYEIDRENVKLQECGDLKARLTVPSALTGQITGTQFNQKHQCF